MSKIKVDVKGLDKLQKSLTDITKKPKDFYEYCAKQLAAELLRRTMEKTPRDTGNLVYRWTDHHTADTETAKQVSIYEWLNDTSIEQKGKRYEITISNPTEYAPYVEYGYRTYKADGTQGWVPGQFMLSLSIDEVEKMKPGLLQRCLSDFMQEVFE